MTTEQKWLLFYNIALLTIVMGMVIWSALSIWRINLATTARLRALKLVYAPYEDMAEYMKRKSMTKDDFKTITLKLDGVSEPSMEEMCKDWRIWNMDRWYLDSCPMYPGCKCKLKEMGCLGGRIEEA